MHKLHKQLDTARSLLHKISQALFCHSSSNCCLIWPLKQQLFTAIVEKSFTKEIHRSEDIAQCLQRVEQLCPVKPNLENGIEGWNKHTRKILEFLWGLLIGAELQWCELNSSMVNKIIKGLSIPVCANPEHVTGSQSNFYLIVSNLNIQLTKFGETPRLYLSTC